MFKPHLPPMNGSDSNSFPLEAHKNKGAIFSVVYLLIALIFSLVSTPLYSYSRSCNENNLGPTVRLDLWPNLITDDIGVAAFGELGHRNLRANGTIGYRMNDCHLFKVSGEWLAQKLGYHFCTGRVHRWMHQQAFGAQYRHAVNLNYVNSFEVGTRYSHAAGQSLHRIRCVYPGETTLIRTFHRHIAGSNAYNANAGTTFLLWCNSSLKVAVEYDYVSYQRKFHSNKIVAGVGASFDFYQILPCNFALDIKGEFRKPYNSIEGLLNWCKPLRNGALTIGLFGSYNHGKRCLPDSANVGIEVGYAYGGNSNNVCANSCFNNSCFASWLADPAVKMPQVLAIAEQRITQRVIPPPPPPPPPPPCVPPTSTTIPEQVVPFATTINFDVSPFFDGQGNTLTFSAIGLPVGVTIDPTTGVIFGPNPATIVNIVSSVTVTGTTDCGSTEQTFIITFLGAPGGALGGSSTES